MAEKVIDLKQYQRELAKQSDILANYENDGSLNSMMIESIIRLNDLTGRLLDIVQTQHETISGLAEHVDHLRKRVR